MIETVTIFPPAQPPAQPDLRIRAEIPVEAPVRTDFQPVIDRLRIIYLQHMNLNDELSLKIQDVADKFIRIDCSKISQLRDILKIAQDCRNQFAQVIRNDFDQALLNEPVVIRDWKFEVWQLNDFINLDKYFGQRQVAISPFDGLPFPEDLPQHEFALAIIELLKTIPDFPQEAAPPPLPPEQLAVLANQMGNALMAFLPQGNGTGTLNRELVNYTPENNLCLAFRRYHDYKRMATCSKQEKINLNRLVQLEIDISARRLANETHLQEIINQEAQSMLAYFEERQQVTEARLEEAEQARVEIASLKTRLDEVTNNLRKLRADLTVQEKRSEGLQQQIYVEQAKYAQLAQEVQRLRQNCKKRPWWKFW